MNRFLRAFVLCIMAALSAVMPLVACAQDDNQATFSQSDLDQLLAPIALYPDDLLSNVLTASTYPLEVVQADRFVKQNPSLQGDALAATLNTQSWDQSVKTLAQFPAVLAMMDDQLSWTQQLGDAFLAQPGAVMDTVQDLRARAQATGSLESNAQQTVVSNSGSVEIQPYVADIVYVPYYDPSIVYGVWWWPNQPPMFWNPPSRYRPNSFGNIGSGAIVYGGRVVVSPSNFNRYRPNWGAHTISVGGNLRKGGTQGVWQHDPVHRQGVAYRTAPSVNHVSVPQGTVGASLPQRATQERGPQQSRQTIQPDSLARQPVPAPQIHPVPQPQPLPQAQPQPQAAHAATAASTAHSDHSNDPRKPNNN